MRSRYSPPQLLLFALVLGVLAGVVQFGALTLAFDRLGLSAESALLLLAVSFVGSAINLPLVTVTASAPPREEPPPAFRGLLQPPREPFHGRTLIAINVGGCLVPLAFSIYLLQQQSLPLLTVFLGVAAVTLVSRLLSRPLPGIGIGMPLFIAPAAAALIAIVLAPEASAPLAYVSGTLGVLIGADLLRLGDIRRMGAPFASIGGAGTFDGIFLTGVVAVLLA